MKLDALILAGGLGRRLRAAIGDRPKPMAEVAGKPFLELLLLHLRAQGFRRIILCTGFMANVIQDYFEDGRHWGLEIVYSQEPEPMDTAGALKFAEELIVTSRVLVLNGDSFLDEDYGSLIAFHARIGARVTLAVSYVDDARRYGMVLMSQHGMVEGFVEKLPEERGGMVSAGVYVIEKTMMEEIPRGIPYSLEKHLFPRLVGKGLYGKMSRSMFVDIGKPDSYRTAIPVLCEVLERLTYVETQ